MLEIVKQLNKTNVVVKGLEYKAPRDYEQPVGLPLKNNIICVFANFLIGEILNMDYYGRIKPDSKDVFLNDLTRELKYTTLDLSSLKELEEWEESFVGLSNRYILKKDCLKFVSSQEWTESEWWHYVSIHGDIEHGGSISFEEGRDLLLRDYSIVKSTCEDAVNKLISEGVKAFLNSDWFKNIQFKFQQSRIVSGISTVEATAQLYFQFPKIISTKKTKDFIINRVFEFLSKHELIAPQYKVDEIAAIFGQGGKVIPRLVWNGKALNVFYYLIKGFPNEYFLSQKKWKTAFSCFDLGPIDTFKKIKGSHQPITNKAIRDDLSALHRFLVSPF